jgi:hypothetical protein
LSETFLILRKTERDMMKSKRPLGRPRHREKNNIKMDLQEEECRVWTGSSWLGIGAG